MSFRTTLPLLSVLVGLSAFACTNKKVVLRDADASEQEAAGTEACDTAVAPCVAASTGAELGSGDGSPESVTFTEIYGDAKEAQQLVDLAFAEKDPTQLWVLAYGDSTVHIGTGVTETSNGEWQVLRDPAAGHFMYKPPALAMGADGYWGTCGDNDDSQNDPRGEPRYFMGPATFTTDLTVFATSPTNLGSHYDMLHNTSFCRGIAHQEANIFWTFNGQFGSIEKYNFNEWHEPGGDDHSDGEIYRYVTGKVKGVEGVSSHLFYDPSDKMLYIADTGNQRIARLDTTTGEEGSPVSPRNEILKRSAVMKNAIIEDVVPAGTLEQPSGIEVKDGLIYVTDAATSTFYVFDKSGDELRHLETGLPKGSLSGFTFGPDGKIYFTDRNGGKVIRIDP